MYITEKWRSHQIGIAIFSYKLKILFSFSIIPKILNLIYLTVNYYLSSLNKQSFIYLTSNTCRP